jgi:hypothetical protein
MRSLPSRHSASTKRAQRHFSRRLPQWKLPLELPSARMATDGIAVCSDGLQAPLRFFRGRGYVGCERLSPGGEKKNAQLRGPVVMCCAPARALQDGCIRGQ